MQIGNPNDVGWKTILGQRPNAQPLIRRGANCPDISWPNLANNVGLGNCVAAESALEGLDIMIRPADGHNSSSFTPKMSYFWGTGWFFYSFQTQTANGAHAICEATNEELIDSAVRYNGGGDPQYRNKIRKALKNSPRACQRIVR